MIVCLCKGVTTRGVRAAIEGGAESLHDVGHACGAGTDCGSCHAEIESMLAEARDDRRARRALPVIQPPPSFRAA